MNQEYLLREVNRLRTRVTELQESEKKYRSFFECASEAICVTQDGLVKYFNPAGQELTGYAVDELLDKPFTNLTHPEDLEELIRIYLQRIRGEYVQPGHRFRIISSTGEIKWVESWSASIEWVGLPAVLSMIRDVTKHVHTEDLLNQTRNDLERRVQERTGELQEINDKLFLEVQERRQAENALRESEQKYRLLAENISDVIWIAGLDLRVIYISPSVERLYGWTTAEWMSLTLRDHLTPASWDLAQKVLGDELAKQGTPGVDLHRTRTLELEQCHKEGSTFFTEVSARFLYNDNGQVDGIIGVTRDITKRKISEEHLKRLATAVESAGETIVVTDAKGTIIYVNPTFEDTSGYSQQEALGRNPQILKSGKQGKAFYQEMWNTLLAGRVWRGRFTNRRKDGSLYEETATISPITDETGRIVSYVAVKRDITTELIMQRQLMQAQKMEAIGTLAGGIAHDFNNLLQAILGYTDLLLMHKYHGDPERHKLEIIRHAACDGADLVSRILTFSKKAESKTRPIDLNEEIRRVEKLLRRTVPKMIEIDLILADDLRIIDADSAQMEQLLLNLAVNAQHAMPNGGRFLIETSNVSLTDEYLKTHLGARSGKYVLLSVSDNGVGMEPSVADRIFEPFFTTKTNGEGTGLGLAIVHGIVAQHGGYINCYSEPGMGTSFKIYFPVSTTEQLWQLTETREMPAFGTETILLVDDDDRIRVLAQQMIEVGGYTVLAASSGEQALETYSARTGEISLVILDLIMPGMGGKRCLQEILRLDPNARVLFASGYSSNGIAVDEKGTGAKGFVRKPYDAKDILAAIRKVIDRGSL